MLLSLDSTCATKGVTDLSHVVQVKRSRLKYES